MTIVAIDTHKFVKELTAAGLPEKQAEIIVRQQTEIFEDQVATKRDVAEAKSELKHDIEVSRKDVILKAGWMIAVASGAIIGVLSMVLK